MTTDIFIGADGGGTKCKVQIEDANGHLIGEARGGPANIRFPNNQAWTSLFNAIEQALHNTNIQLQDKHYRFYAGLGFAGTEIPSAVNQFLAQPHPFAELVLKSDAYAACLGAHGGEDGGIIIAGTGVIGMAVYDDTTVQIGGWGFPCGDEAGGAWLGLEAVRLTMHAYDGRAKFSPLLEAVLQKFNHNFPELVTWANKAKPTDYGTIAPLVIDHLAQNDTHAIALIQRAAAHIDALANAMTKRTTKPLAYALFGGIAPHLKPFLNEKLQSQLVTRQHDAAKGAILMIKKQLGIPL